MKAEDTKFNLKIFLIDTTFYELKNKSIKEIIEVIRDNHKKLLLSKFSNLQTINPQISHQLDGEFEYWAYCFNQPKEKYYWKLFLPDKLVESQDFQVVEFSFVLFIKYNQMLFCVISGSGMNVIKKFINPCFGIDIYQRFAKPQEDVIIEMETRSIASNISHKKTLYNFNQTVEETLEYSEVPSKIKLKIREDLKEKEFKKYNSSELSLLEVGSYFSLRKKLDFDELKELIIDLDQIYNNPVATQLTLFHKINDPNLTYSLDEILKDVVVDDIFLHNTPDQLKKHQSEIIEIVHPSKLEKFYECDNFLIRFKFSHGKNDITVKNRSKLYTECTRLIFNSLGNIADRNEAKKKLYQLNISGLINDTETTYANFFAHITAEVEYLNKKYFKIDGRWYLLEDRFIKQMNNDAKEYYTKYRLEDNILSPWPANFDEDLYNKNHNHFHDCFVLDKVINENIELCDLLVIKNEAIYLIHVKDGFNTKMRDLYIQVILSAKRLSNDLKNNSGSTFLKKTIQKYNELNPSKTVDFNELYDRLRKNRSQINFVMAFNNRHYKNLAILEKIEKCNSNIAKYSLVQVVKEMQLIDFGIKLYDISESISPN